MPDSERQAIAQRISALLQRELGEGVDVKRMLAQPLYARDVLLVCEALHETDLPQLAHAFATERAEAAGVRHHATVASPSATASDPSGPVTAQGQATRMPGNAGDNERADMPSDSPDSGASSWMASLWPATMRGGWLGGTGSKRGNGKPPRRS